MVHGLKIHNGYATKLPGFYPGIIFKFTDKLNVLFGQNACLAEGTKILTTKGVKNIEHIDENDYVYDEFGNPIKVLFKFNTGKRKVVELKSDGKVWAECSHDHVWNCRTNGNSNVCRRVLDFSSKTYIKRLFNKCDIGTLDYKFAYSLGAILGDGCKCNSDTYCLISGEDEDVVKEVSMENESDYSKLNGDNYTWKVFLNQKFKDYTIFCKNKYAHNKIIDINFVKKFNRDSLLRYVAGVVDTDGSIHKTRNKRFDITIAMQNASVISSMEYAFEILWGCQPNTYIDNREKYVNGPCYVLKVSRKSDVFNILKELSPYLRSHKKHKLDLIECPSNLNYIGVSLGKERHAQTYDIHVDSDTNLYCLANGMVTHNSGKSTVLKIVKAYCGIPLENGGWTRVNHPLSLGATCQSHFPWVYKEFSPGHCEATVAWDGTPTFFNEGDTKLDKWAWFTHKDISSEDGMTSETDHMNNLVDNPSSGQYRINKLNKLFNLLKSPPNLTEYVPNGNSQERAEVDYFRSLPRNGKVTLLLDEPERALSVPKQVEMFKLLERMSEDYQIIIATHSPFVLFNINANFINFEKGYDQKCINIFKECVKGLENV